MSKIRGKFGKLKLIKNKDGFIALDTKEQTEVECSARMATYMTLFRSMDIQKSTDGQIIQIIKGYVAREKMSAGNLANKQRINMHRLLAEEQAKVKK